MLKSKNYLVFFVVVGTHFLLAQFVCAEFPILGSGKLILHSRKYLGEKEVAFLNVPPLCLWVKLGCCPAENGSSFNPLFKAILSVVSWVMKVVSKSQWTTQYSPPSGDQTSPPSSDWTGHCRLCTHLRRPPAHLYRPHSETHTAHVRHTLPASDTHCPCQTHTAHIRHTAQVRHTLPTGDM